MDSGHRESIDPQAFKHCSQKLRNGHVYHYIDEVPDTGKATRGLCLLLHGFPDLWQVVTGQPHGQVLLKSS